MLILKKLSSQTAAVKMSLFVVVMLFCTIDPAFAGGGFDKVTTTATELHTMLLVLSLIVVTIAIIFAGYKIAFAGAQFRDVIGILIGGTLIGGASAMAAFLTAAG
jgi:type IV secretion system protein VirB2